MCAHAPVVAFQALQRRQTLFGALRLQQQARTQPCHPVKSGNPNLQRRETLFGAAAAAARAHPTLNPAIHMGKKCVHINLLLPCSAARPWSARCGCSSRPRTQPCHSFPSKKGIQTWQRRKTLFGALQLQQQAPT